MRGYVDVRHAISEELNKLPRQSYLGAVVIDRLPSLAQTLMLPPHEGVDALHLLDCQLLAWELTGWHGN